MIFKFRLRDINVCAVKGNVYVYIFFNCTSDENIIRNTTEGLVLGEKRNNSLAPGESYYAFHAIPYAAAPIGSLRFMPPQNPGKFKEVYNASNADDYKKCCIQVIIFQYVPSTDNSRSFIKPD